MYLVCNAARPVISEGRRFNPQGRITRHGKSVVENPFHFKEGKSYSARIIVGFNVYDLQTRESKPTWNIDDLVRITGEGLIESTQDASATFLTQRGIWKGDPTEEGGQVIILDDVDKPRAEKKFHEDMAFLAEYIRLKMQQWAVVLEIQESGMVIRTGLVSEEPLTEEEEKLHRTRGLL